MTKRPVVVVLSERPVPLARTLAAHLGADIHGLAGRVGSADFLFENVGDHLRRLFRERRPVVAIMATGALVRILAPHLDDKRDEPPIIALSEDGGSVVPLLGGHRGGNDLARDIAALTEGHAAVTTAGDLRFGVALDNPPAGFRLVNPENAKSVMAELVAGGHARVAGDASWLRDSSIPFDPEAAITLTVADTVGEPGPGELLYRPATLALGLGCARGAGPADAIALAENTLRQLGLARESLAGVFSIDLKADETAVHATAAHFGVPARFFNAERLEAETPRLANPSEVVFAEVGCHGVAEGAALAAVGADGALVVPKQKSATVTAALARAPEPIRAGDLGRARGRLFILGIGPGDPKWRSPEVGEMIHLSTDLVGYSLYLDLLGNLAQGKRRHDFDLGAEEKRVRHAMELAGEGRSVSLVCSGDAGIYAMATLAFELLDKGVGEGGLSDAAQRIEIKVSPGISALQAAAARAGAPLGHDFCTISLSDLLTPWTAIERRIEAAARGDFVVAFYNPVSRRRRTQLAQARDILLAHRPADTPVILATNLGRDGEAVRIVALSRLDVDDVDMLTVVIVGSSETRRLATGDGREWVYTPRGYSGKAGSALAAKNDSGERV